MSLPPFHQRTAAEHIAFLESEGYANAARELRAHVEGSLVGRPVFRGDYRADKVQEFDPEKMESGGGIYFTDAPHIASNYASSKPYVAEEQGDYLQWFRIMTRRGAKPMGQAGPWLTPTQKAALPGAIQSIWEDYEGDGLTVGGCTDPALQLIGRRTVEEHIKRARGDVLKAAHTLLLESGMLFGREELFTEVLEKAGIRGFMDDPRGARAGVTPAYLRVTRPIDAHATPADFVARVEQLAAESDDSELSMFCDQLLDEIAHPERPPYWSTEIPRSVTRAAQELGYDAVRDIGGKAGGDEHAVWIVFEPSQVMNAISVRGLDQDLGRDERAKTRSQRLGQLLDPDGIPRSGRRPPKIR